MLVLLKASVTPLMWVVFIVVVSLGIAGCAICTRQDLDDKAKELAGDSAVFCGSLSFDHCEEGEWTQAEEDFRAEAITCGQEAMDAGRGFWFSLDLCGIDSRIAEAFAGTQDGRFFRLWFDSDPSGGSNIGARMEQCECMGGFNASGDCLEAGECGDICG